MTICVEPAIYVVNGSFFQISRNILKLLICGRQFCFSSYRKSSKCGSKVGMVSLLTLELKWQTVYYQPAKAAAPSRNSPLGTFREDERNETSLAARTIAERLLSQASVLRANEEGAWEIWAENKKSKQTNSTSSKNNKNYGTGRACSPASLALLLQSYQRKGYLPPQPVTFTVLTVLLILACVVEVADTDP